MMKMRDKNPSLRSAGPPIVVSPLTVQYMRSPETVRESQSAITFER